MQTEETKDRGNKAKSADCRFSPMDEGMFGMMNKCCGSGEAFSGCFSMMKGMMKTMESQCICSPGTESAGPLKEKEGEK